MNHLSEDQLWQIVSDEVDDSDKEVSDLHLRDCDRCRRELQILSLIKNDLKEALPPDVSEGFALRVAAQVRRVQYDKIFNLPSFRIFRIGLAASFVLMFCVTMFLLLDVKAQINFPRIPGGSYMLLAVLAVMLVFTVDRIVGKKIRHL